MNYKEIVKQTEVQNKAKQNVQKEISRNKATVLTEFSKDILAYLNFIHKSPKFRFSGEAHWYKGMKTNSLLEFMPKAGEKEPWHITKARKEIKEKAYSDIRTTTLGFGFQVGSAVIKFKVDDNFVCKVSYEFATQTHEFTDKEEFVKSFTELLIKWRKDV